MNLDPEAKPKFHKARPVPYAIRPLLEVELDRLTKEGILEPVAFADWAAPIVPVLKPDKQTEGFAAILKPQSTNHRRLTSTQFRV